MTVPSFAVRLRRAQEAQYASTQEILRAAGMSRCIYSRLRNDPQRKPSWDTIYRVLVGGGLGLEHFFPTHMILEAAARIHRQEPPQ